MFTLSPRGDAGYNKLPQKNQTCCFDVGVADVSSVWSRQRRSGCGGGGRTPYICVASSHARNVARTAQPAQAGYDYLRLPDRFHAAGGLFSVAANAASVSGVRIRFLKSVPACTEERRLLVPGRRSMLGRKLLNWFGRGVAGWILGIGDDAALNEGVWRDVRFLWRRAFIRWIFYAMSR